MKKIDRLVGIIYALKENEKITAKELSDIFEVSERTIYRDIDALSQLKVPIQSLEGYGGGYKIDEKYFVPSIAFSEKEIMYLLICLKIGDIINVPNMRSDYESLKYKLLNILDDNTKKQNLKLLHRINFDVNNIILNEYRDDITEKIIESFLDYRDLIIEYYTPRKEEYIERKITPYRLCYYNGGWYIDGYCHLRGENRSFRIDRVTDIKLSESTHDQNFIDKYFNETYKEDDRVTVILEIEKPLYETIKSDSIFIDAKIKDCGDRIELNVLTNKIDTIVQLAIRNYQEIKIIEPRDCIDKLKQTCKKILDRY